MCSWGEVSFKVKVLSFKFHYFGTSHFRRMTIKDAIPTAQPMMSEETRSHASISGSNETVIPLAVATRPVSVALKCWWSILAEGGSELGSGSGNRAALREAGCFEEVRFGFDGRDIRGQCAGGCACACRHVNPRQLHGQL